MCHEFNTLQDADVLRPRQNGRHFTDDIFKLCIVLNESIWLSITIPLKFVVEGVIKNIPGWFRQAIVWTDDGYFAHAYMRHSASMSFNQLQQVTCICVCGLG